MTNDKGQRPAYQPLSASTVSARLADVRRRCGDLLDEDGEIALALEDENTTGNAPDGGFDPYDRGA